MASPPTGDLPHPSVGRGPRAPPGSMHIARRDTWVPPYESYCAPFGAEHHRQADVGADDPVRPQGTAPLMSRRGDVASPPTGDLPHPSVGRGPRAPPGSMHIARRDTWVPPYESYCAPFGAEHHRQADVGADDPVRPNSAKRFRVSDRVTGVGIRSPHPLPPDHLAAVRPDGDDVVPVCHVNGALEALPSRCEHWRGNPFPSSLTS